MAHAVSTITPELDAENMNDEIYPDGRRPEILKVLFQTAWAVRANAKLHGHTQVGAAALAEDGTIWSGCNVEHRYRSHDIHAETNAIGSLVAAGRKKMLVIVVAADRSRFTPCGACMDWIFELGGGGCIVGWQSTPDGASILKQADELMPMYPK